MSALPVHSPSTRFATPRRHLRAVAERTARVSRLPFLLVMASVLGVGLLGLALLNTQLQNQAFEMRQLHREQARLANQEAYLTARVEEVSSPAGLASRASQLGMRPNTHSTFLVVPDGVLVGEPTPVAGNELPSSVVKPPAPPPSPADQQAAAEQKAEDARTPAGADAESEEAAAERAAAEKKAAEEKAAAERAAAEQQAAEDEAAAEQAAAEEAAQQEPTPEEKAEAQRQRNEAEAERARKAATGEG